MVEHAIVLVETYADLTLRQENYVRNDKRWFLCLLPIATEIHLVIGTNNVFSYSFSYSTVFYGMYPYERVSMSQMGYSWWRNM